MKYADYLGSPLQHNLHVNKLMFYNQKTRHCIHQTIVNLLLLSWIYTINDAMTKSCESHHWVIHGNIYIYINKYNLKLYTPVIKYNLTVVQSCIKPKVKLKSSLLLNSLPHVCPLTFTTEVLCHVTNVQLPPTIHLLFLASILNTLCYYGYNIDGKITSLFHVSSYYCHTDRHTHYRKSISRSQTGQHMHSLKVICNKMFVY